MIINKDLAILSGNILLVPYYEHHVVTYHEWMKDESIQKATASESLTIEEEYSMQRSWRKDSDKLTFIICSAPDDCPDEIFLGVHDVPKRMLGDLNLFLTTEEDGVVGEIEVMIATKLHQGQGFGRSGLVAFLTYIGSHEEDILWDYGEQNGAKSDGWIRYLRVKIDKDNTRSIKLFESIGFVKIAKEANYFGEFELRVDFQELQGVLKRFKVEDYRELTYRNLEECLAVEDLGK
ncbi:MAG: hypothetical protein M1827_000706 [Pycnora praestabilis]|nr:MAG: hypothetical protein M1827_000706 [Pycnora praestabilis]